MIFDLPTKVEFGGKSWDINTDYRDVLTVLSAFDDPELNDREKAFVVLYNIYKDVAEIPKEYYQEALDKAIEFIDHGEKKESKCPRTMNWEQDAAIIFPAINHVAGFEVRSVDYLHWWTFIGYFMEIKDSTAATVFGLRQKKARGKKLEKWEQEYWRNNRDICVLKAKLTDKEKEEKEELKKLLGG